MSDHLDRDATDAGRRGAGGDIVIDDPDGVVRWRFERSFLTSTWTCIWGRGCQGIGEVAAPELGLGCCSVGAEMGDAEEAMTTSAMAAMIPAHLWQHADAVDTDDVFSDGTRHNTKVVDGACIFLNRPGFAGGAGCALHLAALDAGESPLDWKPSVCWQLPIRVDWAAQPDGTEEATVRRWTRADWGADGETMAWCCTEEPDAYVGEEPVITSLAEPLERMVGSAVVVALRRSLGSTT